MEVRCSNCSTEYEFDDALVSARGTSVKCTNCGHQFRVHAPTPAGGAGEKWVVRDARGRETTFTSLRELQQAIVRGLIDQKHEMSHAGAPFRPLQDIYELQSFFDAARQRATQQRQPPRTLLGVGRDAVKASRTSVPPPRRRPEPVTGERAAAQERIPAPARAAVPERAVPPERAAPERAPTQERVPVQERVTPVAGVPAMQSVPFPRIDAPPGGGDGRALSESGSRPSLRISSPGPLGAVIERPSAPYQERPSAPYQERPSSPFDAPAGPPPEVPWQHLQGLRDDSDLHAFTQPRSAGLRWILAVVVIGGLALVGATVGRDYLLRYIRHEPEKPLVDQRVPALLEQARVAFVHGDFETAHGALAKASVLAETEPSVATALAKLEVARTEPLWLLQRIGVVLDAAAADKAQTRRRKPTEAEATAEADAAQKQALERKQLALRFQDRMGLVKAAVASAMFRAPNSPDAIRARVDSLRLAGQLKEGRALLAPVTGAGSDPDTAFTLGALDLAEGESGYASAIDRLRAAARAEEGLGRARALLIFVLAQSGDAAAAGAELEKLQTVAPEHPALSGLHSLVDLAQAKQAPPPEETRRPAPSPRPSPAAAAPPASSSGTDDVASLLDQASALQHQGDTDGAERIYQSVLTRSPKSVPALSGLAEIARQRKAIATAAALYDQILKIDRNHVPTLMSRADLYWAAGNRILAVALYRRALSQVSPSDPVGQKALQRIEEYERASGAANSPAPSGSGAEAPSEPGTDTAPATPSPSPSRLPPSASPAPSAPSPSPSSPPPSNPSPSNPPNPSAPADPNAPPRLNPRFPPPPIGIPRQTSPAPAPAPVRIPPPVKSPDGTDSDGKNP